MTNLPPSRFHINMQSSGAQQTGSQGNGSRVRRHAWDHVQENRGSPSTGSQSFESERHMDVDDPPNKDQEMQTLKNTTKLLSTLEGFQSLVELSKQELVSIKLKTPDENALLREELERLKIENRKLQQHHQEMSSNMRDKARIKHLEEEIKTANETADDFQKAFRDISQKHKEELAKTQALNQTLTENKANMDKMVSEYQSRISELQKLYDKAREEKKRSEADLSESRTRLSRLMGNKLANNNPDIADLSDKNRPTKIAERNQELYDNEWTNAFEVIQKHFHNENKTIETMFQILQAIKRQCDSIAKEQEQKLNEAIKLKRPVTGESLSEHILKQLKDFRRFTAEVSLPEVTEKCLEAVKYKLYFHIWKDGDVQKFVQECIQLCWLMNIQDPPLAFGETPNRNDAFDGNAYKFYTETGPFVDFIVWPALLLEKEGSLLSKGIAQAHGRQRAESEKMKIAKSHGSNEAVSNPPGHLQTAPSGQNIDRHIAGTSSQERNQYHNYNNQGQDTLSPNYKQSVRSGQNNLTNDTKYFRHPMEERETLSGADRINKNFGSSQREGIPKRRLTEVPDGAMWQKFQDLVRMYGIDSPEVKLGVGAKFNICKDYYISFYGERTATAV